MIHRSNAVTPLMLCLLAFLLPEPTSAAELNEATTQPKTQMQVTPGLQAGAPTLSTFSINEGANKTADRTLRLAWTSQGAPTHWRVSTSASFPNAPWNPLPPSQTFKWLIAEGTPDGQVTLHMQLLNDHGQSAVKSAQIGYMAPPKITAIEIASTNDLKLPFAVRVSATFSGKVDRFRVTQSQIIDFKEWTPAPASGPLVTTHWVTGVAPNASGTLWVHVQRDGVGQHSASKSFTIQMQRVDYTWSGNQALDVFKQKFQPAISKLTAGDGECTHSVGSGWAHALRAQAKGGALRCRFVLFGGKKLSYGWTLKTAKVSYGDGTGSPLSPQLMRPGSECAIKELVTGGKTPKVAIEVYFPNITAVGESNSGWTSCQLDSLTLTGPSGWPFGSPTAQREALNEALTGHPDTYPNLP